ncbi:TonB-dependent receptor [Bermanella marisrubri]|uniref:TonB-dependent receptor n=1 Tax=Bermanella marisrubri TaxID=207949 RepID=Q1N1C5_9GAMM|nr:TonB-dependent receptor [Bermanella marisrubri]EAT12125.1 hypothetical protein RED65_03765 [Oceanobacter sp. RED65] [Bermanella marisrubri]QIZ83588.1 TonB-dependent receptor [Bermanella marisrubri]
MPKMVPLLYSALLSTFICQVNALQLAELDSFDLDTLSPTDEIPVVLTAARLRQSQLDTPASVTVIESETIAALGFKDIEEIFRLVPGMLVGYHSGVGEKAPSVSYHGTLLPEHRRLQVLIDGRSVFKPGLARVEWLDIPLAIEDIDRIEVIRGPNSAAYGANSYLGVINILTKHPEVTGGNTAKVRLGGRNTQDSYFNFNNRVADTDIRFTLASKQESGFDYLNDGKEENPDDHTGWHFMLRTHTPISSQTKLETQLGYKDSVNGQREIYGDYVDYLEQVDIEAKDTFAWLKGVHEFSQNQISHLQVYWQDFDRVEEWAACLREDIFGLPMKCGELNKNMYETKSELEFQHTSVWNTDARSVAGFRYRLDELESDTVNDGYSSNENISAFLNVEYRLSENWITNLGAMYEEDELNGYDFSPRLALNYLIGTSQTLRFIYSEAIRSPDLYEKQGRLQFTLENGYTPGGEPLVPVVLPFGTATGEIDNETIYSHEISYFGLLPSIHAQLDIKLFYDRLNGLISESLDHSPSNPLSNGRKLQMSGIEGQFKWNPSTFNTLLVSFAYIDTEDDFPQNYDDGVFTRDSERETTLSADISGSLSWIHSFNTDASFAATYYHVDNWNPITYGFQFSRLDLAYTDQIRLMAEQGVELKLNMQYRLDDDPLNRPKNNYADDYLFYGSIAYRF